MTSDQLRGHEFTPLVHPNAVGSGQRLFEDATTYPLKLLSSAMISGRRPGLHSYRVHTEVRRPHESQEVGMPVVEPTTELIPTAFEVYDDPTPWDAARARLASGPTFWLSTTAPDGRPHVRPVLGVWVEDAVHLVTGGSTVKTTLIEADPRITLSTHVDAMDLVLEGEVTRVDEQARLQRVADAYADTYGWRATARAGALTDVEGAPTAGPPPYLVLALRLHRAFGFPHDDTTSPTRWTFRT